MSNNTCPCCGKPHGELTTGAFLTNIAGWHRVRIKTENDISGTTEIGCNNDPALAVKESWAWYRKKMRPPITIEQGLREEEGRCNACQRRDQPLVTVVNLRTLTFRLCEDCSTDLLHKLAVRPPKPGVPA